MMKSSVYKLGLVLPVLVLCISVLTTTALAQSAPLFISGHVTVNGAAAQGVSVSAGSSHTTTDSGGFYQLSPSVSNGSGVTVTANDGNGHQQSKTVTQNMQGGTTADFSITYSTATATPSPTASQPSSGGNGGSNGGSNGNVGYSGSLGYATITPTPLPEVNNSTVTVTITPTTAPTIAPTATPTPTPIPTPAATAIPASGQNNSFPWWLIALLGALGVIVILAYFLLMRKH